MAEGADLRFKTRHLCFLIRTHAAICCYTQPFLLRSSCFTAFVDFSDMRLDILR